MEEKWAKLCLDVLFNEKVFDEYRSYFNFYFVRLASFEEGVDPGLSPEDLKKAQERNLRRRRDINYKLDYSTALDCKAAGPQGQVMADPTLVYKWLDAGGKEVPGCADDKFVIAFKIDAKQTPAAIDMDIKSGPVNEGKAQGIIALEGEELKLCYTAEGKRPARFESTKDNNAFYFVLKRAK